MRWLHTKLFDLSQLAERSINGIMAMPTHSAAIAWIPILFNNVKFFFKIIEGYQYDHISLLEDQKKISTFVGNTYFTTGNISCLLHLWENGCCYICWKM